ncbi:low-density lipoprotein receptor-related protein 12-like isoform X1 [Haliotis rufescens]|uniref:low-density lipoprotein receptor-related protein 12-like isoform X1 n=1 Tax=Haliotis rufescens TaxID=6454 RepID=UPI00201E9850|nr:low-density lipoprotein receptor-related protein 12-like isoform X1 [Haliotis rufescens]
MSLLKVTVVLLCLRLDDSSAPTVYYLDDECNKTTRMTKDVRFQLTLHPNVHLRYNWLCTSTVKTDVAGDLLLVGVRSLNTVSTSSCTQNSLTIMDTDKETALNGMHGECGSTMSNRSYTTQGDAVTLKFRTDDTTQIGQFDILVTSFNMAINHTCLSSRYLCNNNRCINKFLTCNGFDDCGDDSDEIDGCSDTISGAAITGIVVGVLLFFAVCVSLAIIGRSKSTNYRRLDELRPIKFTNRGYLGDIQYRKQPSYRK